MELYKSLGEFAIQAGALAWLVKALVGALLSKDLEAHKVRLQLQSQSEIEQLKSRLAVVVQQQATEFSTLHAKRAELLADLYRLLLSLETAVGILTVRLDYVAARALEAPEKGSSEGGGSDKLALTKLGAYEQGLVHEVEDAYMKFMALFKPSRIYLPEDLCSSIVKATSNAARFSIDFERLAGTFEQLSAADLMKVTQSLVALVSDWQYSLGLLEGEFRLLMGVRAGGPKAPGA